jgi:hypothetical protein
MIWFLLIACYSMYNKEHEMRIELEKDNKELESTLSEVKARAKELQELHEQVLGYQYSFPENELNALFETGNRRIGE